MQQKNLSEQATLFEGVDPLDEQLSGQPVQHAPLRELIEVANGWADARLESARIVTDSDVELRGGDIAHLICDVVDSD